MIFPRRTWIFAPRQTLPCLAALTVVAAVVLGLDGRKVRFWVVGEARGQRIAINPASGERQTLPVNPSEAEIASPDGRFIAIVSTAESAKNAGQGPGGLHIAEIKANGQRVNLRQVLPANEQPGDVQWLPSPSDDRAVMARLVCAHGQPPKSQIYLVQLVLEAGGQNEKIVESRLSDGKDRCFNPRVAGDGKIAWLALRDQKRKESFIDLMVLDRIDRKPKALVERRDITAIAWSPDAAKIAWSTHGSLTITDVKTGANDVRECPKIDERLNAHHARGLSWSPDGRDIAASIRFSGGRLVIDQSKSEPMFGDREVFILPLDRDEKPTWFTLANDCMGVGWIATEHLPQPPP